MSKAQCILYLDPFSGVSGDMFVGALLDLGLPLDVLRRELRRLKLTGYQLDAHQVMRRGMRATQFVARIAGRTEAEHLRHQPGLAAHGHLLALGHGAHGAKASAHGRAHGHRTFGEIERLIKSSTLSAWVTERALEAFTLLARAEGRVHGRAPEKAVFHEVGAVDSLLDIVGACVGLEALGVAEVWCGPVALGGEGTGGYVECAHGRLPVPAFATLELMKGLPLRSCPVAAELTTPTGAALMRALVTRFGPLPPLAIEKIGYGAGSRDDPNIPVPNVLRVVLGNAERSGPTAARGEGKGRGRRGQSDTVIEMQANLDDATPEVLGYAAERLLAAGALDVFFTPVTGKKSRPATLLTVLAEPERLYDLADIVFRETPTFGLRYEMKSRLKLVREVRTVKTRWGNVRVKLGYWRGELVSVHPEYEDCRALAEKHGVRLKEVVEAARDQAALLKEG